MSKSKRIRKFILICLIIICFIIYGILQMVFYFISSPESNIHADETTLVELLSSDLEDGYDKENASLKNMLFADYLDENVSIEVESIKPLSDLKRDFIEDNSQGTKEARLVEVTASKSISGKKVARVVKDIYVITECKRDFDFPSFRLFKPKYLVDDVISTEITPSYYSLDIPDTYDEIISIGNDLLDKDISPGVDLIKENEILSIAPSEKGDKIEIQYSCDENYSFGKSRSTIIRTLIYDGYNDEWLLSGNDQFVEREFSSLDLSGIYTWTDETGREKKIKLEKNNEDKWTVVLYIDEEQRKIDTFRVHKEPDTISDFMFADLVPYYGKVDLSFVSTLVITEFQYGKDSESSSIYMVCSDDKYVVIERNYLNRKFMDKTGVLYDVKKIALIVEE